MGPLVPTITGPQLFLQLKNPWTYFLLAENLTSAFPNTHKPHDTQAEPLAEITADAGCFDSGSMEGFLT